MAPRRAAGVRGRATAPFVLHLEVQLQGDPAMPRRMAEYFGFSLAALERAARAGLRPAAVVLSIVNSRQSTVDSPEWPFSAVNC